MEDFKLKRFTEVKKSYESFNWSIVDEDIDSCSCRIKRDDSLHKYSIYKFKIDDDGVERILEPSTSKINFYQVFVTIFIFTMLFFILFFVIKKITNEF